MKKKEEWKNSLLIYFYNKDSVEGLVPPKPEDKECLIDRVDLLPIKNGYINTPPERTLKFSSPIRYGNFSERTIKVLDVNTGIQSSVGKSLIVKNCILELTHDNSGSLIRLQPSKCYDFKIEYYFNKGFRFFLKEKN